MRNIEIKWSKNLNSFLWRFEKCYSFEIHIFYKNNIINIILILIIYNDLLPKKIDNFDHFSNFISMDKTIHISNINETITHALPERKVIILM